MTDICSRYKCHMSYREAVTGVGKLVDMESGLLTRGFTGTGVHVDAVDVSGLDDAGLDLRLRLIGRARNQLDGYLAEVVAEKKRRTSPYDTANALKAELRQSGQQAQRTMREAEQLEALPATRGALSESRITSEHARILGAAAQAGPLDEKKWAASATPAHSSGPPSPPATKAASAAAPNPSGASPTTSLNGNTAAPPSKTTSCCSATPATTKPTTATGKSNTTPTPTAPT